jgi:hypothetical protein
MAHGFGLGEPGEADRFAPHQAAEAVVLQSDLRKIDTGNFRSSDFEQQRLFVIEAAIARNGLRAGGGGAAGAGGSTFAVQHDSTSSSAAP